MDNEKAISKPETEFSILDKQEMKDFIEDREIKSEDLSLIEILASFPKNLIIEKLHNFFNVYREASGVELEKIIFSTKDLFGAKENRSLDLYVLINEFYLKYDWAASWNLVRLLERL